MNAVVNVLAIFGLIFITGLAAVAFLLTWAAAGERSIQRREARARVAPPSPGDLRDGKPLTADERQIWEAVTTGGNDNEGGSR